MSLAALAYLTGRCATTKKINNLSPSVGQQCPTQPTQTIDKLTEKHKSKFLTFGLTGNMDILGMAAQPTLITKRRFYGISAYAGEQLEQLGSE